MSLDPAHVAHARKVADAVLYEGYLLYPYRGSAQKNQARFQFGVLVPPRYAAADDSERSASQTECLADCRDDAEILVDVRFLHLVQRTAEAASPGAGEPDAGESGMLRVGDTEYRPWDEAAQREYRVTATVAALLGDGTETAWHIGAGQENEDILSPAGQRAGRLVRRWDALDCVIALQAQRVAGPFQALRLRLRVENHTAPDRTPGTRDEALRGSLIAAHALIAVPGGRFLSLTDPPEWAAAEAAACQNTGTWPVLAGPADCQNLMLSAPVILYDHPEVAAESAGDLFDATEIDEILTLRTLALTDAEKQEARATDPRAAELLDRLDGLPPEMIERMHGAIRYLRSVPAGRAAADTAAAAVPVAVPPEAMMPVAPDRMMPLASDGVAWPAPGDAAGLAPDGAVPAAVTAPAAPWWDPGADTSVSPETDHVLIGGVPVARGSRVIMRPGARRADAQDFFLSGRSALVEAVLGDVDGQVHIAVSPENDPAADLQRSHGRFLYFAPDELEPVTDPAQRRTT